MSVRMISCIAPAARTGFGFKTSLSSRRRPSRNRIDAFDHVRSSYNQSGQPTGGERIPTPVGVPVIGRSRTTDRDRPWQNFCAARSRSRGQSRLVRSVMKSSAVAAIVRVLTVASAPSRIVSWYGREVMAASASVHASGSFAVRTPLTPFVTVRS